MLAGEELTLVTESSEGLSHVQSVFAELRKEESAQMAE